MNKKIALVTVLAIFLLSACSVATPTAAESTQDVTANSSTSSVTLNTSYADAVSVELQLLYGTLTLEGTDQVVTADQAATLLPLWQSLAVNGMGNIGGGGMQSPSGDTSGQPSTTPQAPAGGDASTNPQAMPTMTTLTQDEIDSVVSNIEAALTSGQLAAIAAMNITQTMIDTYVSENNLGMGGGMGNGQNGGQAPDDGSTPPAMPSGSGDPSQSGGQPQGGQQGSGQSATPDAGMQGNMTTNRLINAVVQYLQQKTGVSQSTNAQPEQLGVAPGGDSSTSSATIAAAYTVDGQTLSEVGKTYAASNADESAILVTNGGDLTVTNAAVTSSGDSSSTDNSSFYGQNAAVLAQTNSSITMSNSSITTSGIGANGAFANGENSLMTLSDVTIHATGNGGHAVMATLGGTMVLTNVAMTTSGDASSAIATDRGSGTISVTSGTVDVSGANSAGIYSTGVINVTGATITATGAEAAVIEGANYITLDDTSLTSTCEGKWGVMIYQSMSGDAEGSEGTFSMTGGDLAYTSTTGPLFYVTNASGIINLKSVNITTTSGILLRAEAGNWGDSGSNGGTVNLTADGQKLPGSIIADNISSISLTLNNGSVWTGATNSDRTAESISVTLDGSSSWTLTGNSYVTTLTGAIVSGSSVTNITGNGFNLYYDASANPSFNGQTFSLMGGGSLMPAD